MLTIFCCPKPFRGESAAIQRAAIGSWLALRPQPQVLVFGDEPGAAQAAEDLGATHLPVTRRTSYGTPLVNDIFERAEAAARHPLLCYANADVIMTSSLARAATAVAAASSRFLLVGECLELPRPPTPDFGDPRWEEALERQARSIGVPRGPFFIDYCVFTAGLFPAMPPFALGRSRWDNWLIAAARRSGAWVVEASAAVTAVHQPHEYDHVAGGRSWCYHGPEARMNQRLSGLRNWVHLHSVLDATHSLADGRIRTRRPGTLWSQFALRAAGLVRERWPRPRGVGGRPA